MDAAKYGGILLQICWGNMNFLLRLIAGFFAFVDRHLRTIQQAAGNKTADKSRSLAESAIDREAPFMTV